MCEPIVRRTTGSNDQIVDDVHYAVCQGDVAYDDAGPVDSCTVCVATDVQHLAVEGEQVIAIDQSRHEPRTANDVAPQNVCALLLHHNRNKF